MYEELKDQVKRLPVESGVYLMKDQRGEIIYVGKAKSLRKRVISYFNGSRDIKTRVLASRIHTIDHITTRNEYEALLLENNLIKRWKPRYNINLKDGKTYPVIRVTNEDFPRVFRTRRIIQDGSSYYGPFPNAGMVDTYLELIERIFPLRKCPGDLSKRKGPCFYYHIGRCAGPCIGKITKEEYAGTVEKVKELLSGETEELVAQLGKEMGEAGAELKFERAAQLRDAIEAIRTLGREQEVVDFDPEVRDYVALAHKDQLATFIVFQMRGGRLQGRDLFRSELYASEEEAMVQFLLQYYGTLHTPPAQLFVSLPFEPDLVTAFFRNEKGKEVDIQFPHEGKHWSVVRMALENGMQDIENRRHQLENIPALEELKRVLGLPKLPRRIEGFDIAHLHGKHTVASMVSFHNGFPDKRHYRYFHVKSLKGAIDDFESMREVIARRYTRVINEDLDRPDFILVDGGKGQVSAAREILDAVGLADLPLAGLAKRLEEIYLPHRSEPVRLADTSPALKVLQSVRDEAHRFATSFNKRLREKDLSFSLLQQVPGIGERRSRLLLEEFGSLDAILAAASEEIADRCSMSRVQAEAVLAFLKSRPRAAVADRQTGGGDAKASASAGFEPQSASEPDGSASAAEPDPEFGEPPPSSAGRQQDEE